MRVLADFHHAELFYSLQLLFEKRLKAELYRPIGMDWYYKGYWHVYPHIDTAKQFLATDQAIDIPKDIHGNYLPRSARVNEDYRFEDGIYYVNDVTKDKVQRGITLDKFKEMEFDILVSSIPQHIEPFNKLINKFQPRAKHVFQVGNAWGHQPGVRNVLASTAPFETPNNTNVCFYHQEFDLDVFKYQLPNLASPKKICSYIHYMKCPELFDQYAIALNDFQFCSFGAGMSDSIMKTQHLANQIRDSTFTWHYKPEGDGYGHIIHNTFAVGRPPLVWKPFYTGKLAEDLMIDGQTCIDISRRSFQENVALIRKYSHPERYIRMCKAANRRFCEIVNFSAEEVFIRKFLDALI